MYDNIKTITREFDPGSGLTLAAHIRHASRTEVVVMMLTWTENLFEGIEDWLTTMALVADWWVTRKQPAY